MPRTVSGVLLASLATLLATLPLLRAASPPGPADPPFVPRIHLISTEDLVEREFPAAYGYCSISDDGRFVAYTAVAGMGLEREKFPGYLGTGAFVVDRALGTRQRIDAPLAGQRPRRFEFATVSGDGEWVAVVSEAEDLVPDDTNGVEDVFLWHRPTGAIERVSVSSEGVQGNGPSGRYDILVARPRDDTHAATRATNGEMWALAVSTDARFVAFASAADNLVPHDDNAFTDVFLRDRLTGTTSRVSVGSHREQALRGSSHGPAISPNGRYVAFFSKAARLDNQEPNGFSQVYVRDTWRGITACISTRPDGRLGTGDSEEPHFSGDGRFVVFVSQAADLVRGDQDDRIDVYIRDLSDMSIQRIAAGDPEEELGRRWYWQDASLSRDGTLLAFSSTISHHRDDTNSTRDLYLLNRRTGEYRLLSRALRRDMPPANGESGRVTICMTPDGRSIAFGSGASDLVEVDLDTLSDVFVVDLDERVWEEATP